MQGERMDIGQIVTIVLGGGLLGSVVTWLTNRHRPKVDQAQVVLTGSDNLINQLQEERDRLDRRIDQVEQRAHGAETRATDAEATAAFAVAKVADLADHHLTVVRGFAAGTIPPLPPIPRTLTDILTDADYPAVWPTRGPTNRHDTGVPGVEQQE